LLLLLQLVLLVGDGRDVSEGKQVLVLPLLNAHVKLLPLGGHLLVFALLQHARNGQLVDAALVAGQSLTQSGGLGFELLHAGVSYLVDDPHLLCRRH
jgi:hypothetical protein